MTSPTETHSPSEAGLTVRMAGAVKAELARRDLSGADLVRPLGLNRNAVYSRLKGDHPFDVRELEQVAKFLDISLAQLLMSADLGRSGA